MDLPRMGQQRLWAAGRRNEGSRQPRAVAVTTSGILWSGRTAPRLAHGLLASHSLAVVNGTFNTAPTFVGFDDVACRRSGRHGDLKSLLPVSDSDSGRHSPWSQSGTAPAHGRCLCRRLARHGAPLLRRTDLITSSTSPTPGRRLRRHRQLHRLDAATGAGRQRTRTINVTIAPPAPSTPRQTPTTPPTSDATPTFTGTAYARQHREPVIAPARR